RDRLPERRHRALRPGARRADASERGDLGARERVGGVVDEVTTRYANVREALARDGLDAALVCGSEESGCEGAVTYMSGFTIVHRYAYVLLPLEGEPTIVFPPEERHARNHSAPRSER